MNLRNPIPGTTRAANNGGYDADSGLDILVPSGTNVYAPASGRIIYAERGHTPWTTPPDTPNSVLLELDQPFDFRGYEVRFCWFTHLSSLAQVVPDGSMGPDNKPGRRVQAGDLIGRSGVGNRVPHLHFGLLSDRAQGPGETMPHRLVAELIWDQAAPVSPAAGQELELTFYMHDGKHAVRLRNAGELDGVYQVLEPAIGDGFLRFGLGLVRK